MARHPRLSARHVYCVVPLVLLHFHMFSSSGLPFTICKNDHIVNFGEGNIGKTHGIVCPPVQKCLRENQFRILTFQDLRFNTGMQLCDYRKSGRNVDISQGALRRQCKNAVFLLCVLQIYVNNPPCTTDISRHHVKIKGFRVLDLTQTCECLKPKLAF